MDMTPETQARKKKQEGNWVSLKLKASIHQKATISEKQATGRRGIHIYDRQSILNKYFIKDNV